MDPENICVIPCAGSEHHASLLEDCDMVTRLMKNLVREHQTLTVDEAFAIVKLRLIDICVLDWDGMQPRLIQD